LDPNSLQIGYIVLEYERIRGSIKERKERKKGQRKRERD
jgi:hypothetical protein